MINPFQGTDKFFLTCCNLLTPTCKSSLSPSVLFLLHYNLTVTNTSRSPLQGKHFKKQEMKKSLSKQDTVVGIALTDSMMSLAAQPM
jgi:hypothetical protein